MRTKKVVRSLVKTVVKKSEDANGEGDIVVCHKCNELNNFSKDCHTKGF